MPIIIDRESVRALRRTTITHNKEASCVSLSIVLSNCSLIAFIGNSMISSGM